MNVMEAILYIIGGIFAVVIGYYVLSLVGAAVACAFGYNPDKDTDDKDMFKMFLLGLVVVLLFLFFVSLFV